MQSHTTPEDNSEGCALQEGVSGTPAWLCTKEILKECTGAGAAANHMGKIPSTHRRFHQSSWCREEAGYPQSMHHQETVEKAGRMGQYKVASSRLATLLQFCRRPEQSAVDPLAEGEEGDAEEL
ncbi:hypothetical protein NDU88_009405 [Pleurodeles waltl]|uniref:Uncharacterized protein n=1 Tax=Pleurodeles waltl TaxID=8319 RepID=A0AAV7P239_PLEWA|nr:hypothetical protein NDU88_009405 [Pleurodeles waltl]